MIKVLFVRWRKKVDEQKILKLSENSPSLMFVELVAELADGWDNHDLRGKHKLGQNYFKHNKIFAEKCGKHTERNRSKVNQAFNTLVVYVLNL